MATRTLTVDLKGLTGDPPVMPDAYVIIVRTDTTDLAQPIFADDAILSSRVSKLDPNAQGVAEITLYPNTDIEQPTQYELWIRQERIPFTMPDADTSLLNILHGRAPPTGQTFYMAGNANRMLAGSALITALTGGTTSSTRSPIAVPTLAAQEYLFFAQPAIVSDPTVAKALPSQRNQFRVWMKRSGTIMINNIQYEVWVTRIPVNQAESGREWEFS